MADDPSQKNDVKKPKDQMICILKEIIWKIFGILWSCMQYLLSPASHWLRWNGWNQLIQHHQHNVMITNKTLWILSKIMFEATLFNSKISTSIAAGALNGIEKGLILTGRCYCRSQIDIVRVRQYWNSICQVRPTTVQLGKDFLRR